MTNYSKLTSGKDALVAAAIAALTDGGYSWNPLTTSFSAYLATALSGVGGQAVSNKSMSVPQLLAGLVNAAGAGPVSHLTSSVDHLLATVASSSFRAPPSQAIAAGFTTHAFASTFASSKIDRSNTKAPGSQWYLWNFFGGQANADAVINNDDGSVTLNGDTTGPGGQIATLVDLGSGTYAGRAFGGGGYFEATLSFNPQNVIDGSFAGWPAWWSMSAEHLVQSGDDWPGQATGFKHFIEVDFMEYLLSSLVPSVSKNFYASSYHDWYNNPLQKYDPPFWETVIFPPPFDTGTDFTQYHKYGCLWVPATDSALGYLEYYFDDVVMFRSNGWRKYSSAAAPLPAPAYTGGHTVDDFGWQGNNVRVVLAPTLLGNVSGANIIVSIRPDGSADGGMLDSCWVGHAAATGNEYNFDGNQKQVTFLGGQTSLDLGGISGSLPADPVPFAYDHTRKLVVAMHFSGNNVTMSQETKTGGTSYCSVAPHNSSSNVQADTSSQTTVTLATTLATTVVAVDGIQVADYTAPSIIDNNHLALILGTYPGMPMKVKSVNVWQK